MAFVPSLILSIYSSLRQRRTTSSDSRMEMGQGGQTTSSDPAQGGADDGPLIEWLKYDDNKKRDNDPRCMAWARALDSSLSMVTVSRPLMQLGMDLRSRQSHEAEEKVVAHPTPGDDEWYKLLEDAVSKQRIQKEEIVLNARVLSLPQPSESAMASAEPELRRFNKNFRFPLEGDPNCHIYLESMDEVQRFLRALLRHKHIRRLLFWMPAGKEGDVDTRLMDPTAINIKHTGMAVLVLGIFGLVLFKGVSETWTKVVVYLATAAGVFGVMLMGGSKKNALLLGLMAVMASVIFGGRDNV